MTTPILIDREAAAKVVRQWVVSVVMVKQDACVVNTQNKLYQLGATSYDEARGKAMRDAQADFPEHQLHTVCAIEVDCPAALPPYTTAPADDVSDGGNWAASTFPPNRTELKSMSEASEQPPERVRVVVRASSGDNEWIGVAYAKDYTGDPSMIHEYARATPSDAAVQAAAEDIGRNYEVHRNYCKSNERYPCPPCDCEAIGEIAAIITKHLAARTDEEK